jgi:peroxiredoxin
LQPLYVSVESLAFQNALAQLLIIDVSGVPINFSLPNGFLTKRKKPTLGSLWIMKAFAQIIKRNPHPIHSPSFEYMATRINSLHLGLFFSLMLGVMALPAQEVTPFTLPDVSGKPVSLTQFNQKQAVVLVFISANCPFVDHYESRINALYDQYQDKGVAFVAINSNDSAMSPPDATARLAVSVSFPFPYLKDNQQRVTRALGASKNPQVFVLVPGAGRFQQVYQGAIDDFPLDASQAQAHYLRDALDAVLAGRQPAAKEVPAKGCGIRWVNR